MRNLFSLFLLLVSCGCALIQQHDNPSHVRRAETLAAERKYDEAIDEYRRHITARLAVPGRPEWENPYFYMLLIGDLELQKGNVDGALASYQEAEKNGIEAGLVTDRYRRAGGYLAEQGKPKEAIELLRRYRDRDPLLIDAMCDRLARQLVEETETEAGEYH